MLISCSIETTFAVVSGCKSIANVELNLTVVSKETSAFKVSRMPLLNCKTTARLWNEQNSFGSARNGSKKTYFFPEMLHFQSILLQYKCFKCKVAYQSFTTGSSVPSLHQETYTYENILSESGSDM